MERHSHASIRSLLLLETINNSPLLGIFLLLVVMGPWQGCSPAVQLNFTEMLSDQLRNEGGLDELCEKTLVAGVKRRVEECKKDNHANPFLVEPTMWRRLEQGQPLPTPDWKTLQWHHKIKVNVIGHTDIYHISVDIPGLTTFKGELMDNNVRYHFAMKIFDLGVLLADALHVQWLLRELAINMCERLHVENGMNESCIESEHVNKMRYYKYWSKEVGTTQLVRRAMIMFFDLKACDLFNFHKQISPIPEAMAYRYAVSMVKAVDAVRAEGVAHRDIKLDNFLVAFQNGELELTDFGISKEFDVASGRTYSGFDVAEGFAYYLAPEVYAPGSMGYDPMVSEIWSIAWALFVLVCKQYPIRVDAAHFSDYRSGRELYIPVMKLITVAANGEKKMMIDGYCHEGEFLQYRVVVYKVGDKDNPCAPPSAASADITP